MPLAFLLVLVLILAGVAAVAAGWGDSMPEPGADKLPLRLPERDLDAQDLARITFSPALRGYRCDEVDAVLARLQAQLSANHADSLEADGALGVPRRPAGSAGSAGQEG